MHSKQQIQGIKNKPECSNINSTQTLSKQNQNFGCMRNSEISKMFEIPERNYFQFLNFIWKKSGKNSTQN